MRGKRYGTLVMSTILFMAYLPVPGQAEVLLYDTFDAQSFENWDWFRTGTGFSEVAGGMATFTVTGDSTSEIYSDAEINDLNIHPPQGRWLYVSVEMRIRCSNDNVSAGQGSRGWGFWNGSMGKWAGNSQPANIIWFMSLSPDSFAPLRGLKAYVIRNDVIQPPVDLSTHDISDWNTYRLDWYGGYVSFFINDRQVATLLNPPDVPLGLVIWVDNYVLTCSLSQQGCQVGNLNLDEDQFIELDYVKISQLDGGWGVATPAAASVHSEGAVRNSTPLNYWAAWLPALFMGLLLRRFRTRGLAARFLRHFT